MGNRIPLTGGRKILPAREDLEVLPWRHFAQGLRGRGGRRGGGGGTPTSSFFNIPAPFDGTPSYVGSAAVNWTNDHFKDGGGFCGPRSPGVGYGGITWSIHASFWVRFNKQLNLDYNQYVFQLGRHNDTANYFGLSLFNNSSANPGIFSLTWAGYEPWLVGRGVHWDAASVPKLFLDYQGKVFVDKWFWIYVQGGQSPSMLVLDEDDVTDENTTLNTSWDGGQASRIADSDTPGNWLAEIGTEVRSATIDPGWPNTPQMDFCNLRVGFGWDVGSAFWANQYWKKQIDVDAERAAYVTAGGTEENSKKQYSYGYPFQTDYKCQGGYGTDFTPYSGSIISGTGPRLIA